MIGGINGGREGIILERELTEATTGEEMKGVEVKGRRHTTVKVRQRAGVGEERSNQGMRGVKAAGGVADADMFEEKEQMRERNQVIEETRGGREAYTEGEAESVALKDLEGLIELGGGRISRRGWHNRGWDGLRICRYGGW